MIAAHQQGPQSSGSCASATENAPNEGYLAPLAQATGRCQSESGVASFEQRSATLLLRPALERCCLRRTAAIDGTVRFCVGRKRVTLNLTDLDAVECFLTGLEARK